jgi:hypothetical protein
MSAKPKDTKEPETPAPAAPEAAPATQERTGASVYALYLHCAGGKSHRNEPLPVAYADLTEERQVIWDQFAAALHG